VRIGRGADTVTGGTGRDVIRTGAGNDSVDVADGVPDFVSCGRGEDSVRADRSDRLRGCEQRERVSVIP
jgi:Ca2+-binding RTX toxin-like protein